MNYIPIFIFIIYNIQINSFPLSHNINIDYNNIPYTYIYTYTTPACSTYRQNMHNIFTAAEPDPCQQALYKQFMQYMKGTDKKHLQSKIEQQYKKLYSEMHKSNNIKKSIVLSMENKENNMRFSGCKFRKIQTIDNLVRIKDQFVRSQVHFPVHGNSSSNTHSHGHSQVKVKQKQKSKQKDMEINQMRQTILVKQRASYADTEKTNYFQSIYDQNINDRILIQQGQRKQLNEQIENYKKQINAKTKQITQIKKQIKTIDLQQNKFMQAEHLANNIIQFTDQFSIVNTRSYNKMLQQQQSILSKLKKLRIKAKNQLTQTQFLYQQQQRQHQQKQKKLIKSCIPLQIDQEQVKKKIQKIPKSYKKFLQFIQKVMQLLAQKQTNFNAVKQQVCTRLTGKKIDIQLLPVDRAQWCKLIQEFQEKHEMRVQSSDKLLVKLYHQIQSQNQRIQKQILQHETLLQNYHQQYQQLLHKLHQNSTEYSKNVQNQQFQKQKLKKIKKIRINSILFIQIIQVINSLLIKFRYIFKLFIMMNIDKRKLSDHLLRLDQVLDCNKGLGLGLGIGGRVGENFGICGSNNGYGYGYSGNNNNNNGVQDVNMKEMEEILGEVFADIDKEQIRQLLSMFFYDMRTTLICRKTVVMEQLPQPQKRTVNDLIHLLETIKDQCQYSYNQKLKGSLKILFDCLKSSNKSNQNLASSAKNYGSHMNNLISSRNNLLNSDLHLPSGMFPKVKIQQNNIQQQDVIQQAQQQCKWVMQMFISSQQKQKPQQWGKQQKKNPSIMVRKLLAIRNQSTRKFKHLDLHQCQKKYLKESQKLVTESLLPDQPVLVTSSSQSKSQKDNNSNSNNSNRNQERPLTSNKIYKNQSVYNTNNTNGNNSGNGRFKREVSGSKMNNFMN